jgi:hypothetical protein
MRILDGGGQAGNPGMAFREMSSGASKSSTSKFPTDSGWARRMHSCFPKSVT